MSDLKPCGCGGRVFKVWATNRGYMRAACTACEKEASWEDCDELSVEIAGEQSKFARWYDATADFPEEGSTIVGITKERMVYVRKTQPHNPFLQKVVTTHWCYAPEPEDVDGFRDWKKHYMAGDRDEVARIVFDAARNAGKEGK